MGSFFRSLYLSPRFFIGLCCIIVLYSIAFAFPIILTAATIVLYSFITLFFLDIWILFGNTKGIRAHRILGDTLSNGDSNDIYITIDNFYPFTVRCTVIDEVPFQFQYRDSSHEMTLQSAEHKRLHYTLRPVKRGEYSFGAVLVFVRGTIGLIQKRYRFDENKSVRVYPSYLQMRHYELMAHSHRLTEIGIKRIRKLGHSMEFEHIRPYVLGDDYRTINWKASARSNDLMVNHYTDEKSQQVFCIIDKGRTMKMPFEGMTLVDYAINATLVLANIAIQKQDKAGLMTFSHKVATILPPDRNTKQMFKIQEALYAEKSNFMESDFERLFASINAYAKQRSLIIIFTNMETLSGLQRNIHALQSIARRHLLVIVFFENTELRALLHSSPDNVEEVYHKAIAEKFAFEKKLIVKELERYGIQPVLTSPQNLTIDILNKYIEIKARRLL
ncbi:MAG TPA: DUF58 domain-containing protein [Candidatus Kapabacteria bacterium]|nr:DUF58 domain-containing protein [Ignavibacteria bacterium]HRE56743.1 DUF58 domain-containing protein [Candidatus Kapabacteria bacterium]HRK58423.1 DUF58 domain-containing protein [Candidatus Kapabacteria bacterium]